MTIAVGFSTVKERKTAMARLPSMPRGEIKGVWVTLHSRTVAAEFVKNLIMTGACFDVVLNG